MRTNQAQINAQYTNIRDTYYTTVSNLYNQQQAAEYATQQTYSTSNAIAQLNNETAIQNNTAQYRADIASAGASNTQVGNLVTNILQGGADGLANAFAMRMGGDTVNSRLGEVAPMFKQAGLAHINATNQQIAQLNSVQTSATNANNSANATLANAQAQAETAKNIAQMNSDTAHTIGIANAKLAERTGIRILNSQMQDLTNAPVQIQSMGNNQSWFNEKLEQVLGERYDMVVSNPPYIATSEIDWLERDVKDHDPRLALDGGDDGYKHYRQIAKAAYGLLKQGGYILLEGGINQAEEIRKIFENENFEHKETCMDLAGIKRCIILKK